MTEIVATTTAVVTVTAAATTTVTAADDDVDNMEEDNNEDSMYQGNLQICRSFGRGASKSTTQGGIFDLIMYITFDCAEIAAF
jgi:hypothetical protein